MSGKIFLVGVLLALVAFSTITEINAVNFLKTDSVLNASSNIKTFVEKNGQLPNYVTIENKKFSMDQYLLTSSYIIICEGKMALGKDAIYYEKNEIKKANKPTPRTIKANIDMLTVYDMAGRTRNYIGVNEKTPSLIGSKYGDVQFQTAVYCYAKVLDYYKRYDAMPKFVSLNVAKTSKLANYMPKF